MKRILNLIGLSECGNTSTILSPYSNLRGREFVCEGGKFWKREKMTKWIIYTMHLNWQLKLPSNFVQSFSFWHLMVCFGSYTRYRSWQSKKLVFVYHQVIKVLLYIHWIHLPQNFWLWMFKLGGLSTKHYALLITFFQFLATFLFWHVTVCFGSWNFKLKLWQSRKKGSLFTYKVIKTVNLFY